MELSLFRDGPYMALTLTGAAVNTTTVMFLFVVPLTLQGQWDLSVVLAGTAFLVPALAMSLTGPVAGQVPPRAAVRLMAGCLCGGALVPACLARASSLSSYVAVATVGGAVLGVADSLTLVATQGGDPPGAGRRGSGVTKTVITVAAGLGVGLAGAVTDQDHGVGSEAVAESAPLITAAGRPAAVPGPRRVERPTGGRDARRPWETGGG